MHNEELVVEVRFTDEQWHLSVPGRSEPVRCDRMADAKAALYDVAQDGTEPALSLFTRSRASLTFAEDGSSVAATGSQVLVAASTWGPVNELLVTHDAAATGRHLNVFSVDHDGFPQEDSTLAVFLDRGQSEWLSRTLGEAAQRLPDPRTGDWDPNVFAW